MRRQNHSSFVQIVLRSAIVGNNWWQNLWKRKLCCRTEERNVFWTPSSTGRPPLHPLSLSTQSCQSVYISFLCLRLISDTESSALKWCRYPPFPKVKMRNRLGIQIATDQMNGRDFELLISLSQSFWSPDTKRRDYGLRGSLSKPSGCSANSDILHTYRFQFFLQHCYYIFDSFFKEAIFLLMLLLLIPYVCHISASLCFWEIQRKVEPLRLHFVHHL